MKKHLLAMSLLAAVAVPASAEGVYIFGDVGQSKLSIEDDGWDVSKTDTAFSFGVGYALNSTFALEVAYRDFGKVTLFQDQYEKDRLDSSALQVSVLAKFPVSDAIDIYGRAGVARLTYDWKYQDFEYPEYNDIDSESKSRAFFGIGASYALNDNISLRAEYNRYAKWDEATASALTIGAVYSF